MVGVLDQFKGKQRSPYLTSSMRAANTRSKQVRNPVTGELMETAAERRARERGISDEDLGRLEEAGFADRDEYLAMRADINKKRQELSAMRKAEYAAQKEYVRRTNKAIASGQIEGGQLLPEPVNPSKPRATKGAGRTAEQRALDAENAAQMEALRSQQRLSAIAAPGVIGAGVGGVTGEEDSDMTPLQRALLMGAAGAVGGGLALRRFRAGREVVTPSIPELAPVALASAPRKKKRRQYWGCLAERTTRSSPRRTSWSRRPSASGQRSRRRCSRRLWRSSRVRVGRQRGIFRIR
jgi:hypothetical protein